MIAAVSDLGRELQVDRSPLIISHRNALPAFAIMPAGRLHLVDSVLVNSG